MEDQVLYPAAQKFQYTMLRSPIYYKKEHWFGSRYQLQLTIPFKHFITITLGQTHRCNYTFITVIILMILACISSNYQTNTDYVPKLNNREDNLA